MVKSAGHGMSRCIDPVCVCRPESISELYYSPCIGITRLLLSTMCRERKNPLDLCCSPDWISFYHSPDSPEEMTTGH